MGINAPPWELHRALERSFGGLTVTGASRSSGSRRRRQWRAADDVLAQERNGDAYFIVGACGGEVA
jgi:hypothetical protein